MMTKPNLVATIPKHLKAAWVHAAQKRGMKLTDYVIEMTERGRNMNVYPINETLADDYHGTGYAVGALVDGKLVKFLYLEDISPKFSEMIEAADTNGLSPQKAMQYFDDPEIKPQIRQLQMLGELTFGLLSCWEFCEL